MPQSAPQLPRELWEYILSLALPHTIAYATVPERQRALLAFSRVNSTWRESAQTELFKHVALPTPEAAESFLRVLRSGERGEELARTVRTVRIGLVREAQPEDKLVRSEAFKVAELLERCTALEELWGSGLKDGNIEQTGLCPSSSPFLSRFPSSG